MRQLVYIFLLVVLGACSKESLKRAESPIRETQSNNVSLSDVRYYVHHVKGVDETKSSEVSILPIISEKDTVLYLVTYEDGWELLTADRRAPRSFAKAEHGKISVEDISSIPALSMLYENCVDNISFLKAHPYFESKNNFYESWDVAFPFDKLESSSRIVTRSGDFEITQNHLLQTKWGQGHPWNIRAPYTSSSLSEHCLTGCGPVAIAQYLYYLNAEEGLDYSPYADSQTLKYIPNDESYITLNSGDVFFYSGGSSVWTTMPLDSLCTNQSFAAVSTFMIDIGIATQSQYGIGSTFTYANKVSLAFLSYFHISVDQESADFDTLSSLIIEDNNPAIMLIGYRNGMNYWVYGHFVVADAMKEVYQNNQLTGRYVGFNWGWDGFCDNLWINTDTINWTINNTTFNSIACVYYILSNSL